MKTKLVLIMAGFVLLAILPQTAPAADERPDWWQVQRELDGVLLNGGTNIADLVRAATNGAFPTAHDALFQASVFMRAGMNQAAIGALKELKAKCPGLDNYQVSGLYQDAGEHRQAWELARAIAEIFSDNISSLALCNGLFDSFEQAGWSVDRVDAWLADRGTGRDGFWVKERLQFNRKHDRGDDLIRDLEQGVNDSPTNAEVAVAFLEAITYAQPFAKGALNLAWLTQTVKPGLATGASEIAARLEQLADWTNAAFFFRQAIAIPLTGDEVRQLGEMRQVMIPFPMMEAEFAVGVREGLARVLLKMGLPGEAQLWMVEAQDIREKNKLGHGSLLAGQVQGESGQRRIEERILAEEQKSETDPEYWRERARYYRGRKEPAQEEAALKKGLALTTPQLEPEHTFKGKGHTDWRSWMLSDYAAFLAREKRPAEAVALLRKEIEVAPASAESATRAARILAFDFEKEVRVEDDVLWAWLTGRPKWEFTEERLLWRMLENAKREVLEAPFARAEKLAAGADPTRARTLGWIMNRMGFPKRSISLLEYAVERAADKDFKATAAFTLFESYLDIADWVKAERVFPEAGKQLTPSELPVWYAKIAVIAAKAGEGKEAMRIFRKLANLAPTATNEVDELARYGLRKDLIAFYRAMQQALPESEVPGKVLKNLDAKP